MARPDRSKLGSRSVTDRPSNEEGDAGGQLEHHHRSYETTLVVKIIVVAIPGTCAALHARARSPAGLAVFGALTGISALAALFLGILLAD